MKKPNIIIFNPDQMRTDALGHMGNPASQTPFIDSFAQYEGVSFRNAFCQNTVCVPSRCSFTTGLYPHVNGHRTMSHLLREGESTIFKELKDAGYHVWMNARNDLIAGQVEGLIGKHVSEVYFGGEGPDNPGPVNKVTTSLDAHGYYSFYQGELDVDENGINYGPDDEDLDAALKQIINKKEDQPLCLFLGLINPHPPYQVEEPFFSAIDRLMLKKRIRQEDTQGKAKILELIRKNQKLDDYTEEEWDELRACYLGMCMKVDKMFEKLCDALKASGEYDNSLIIFMSDHGDYTGDYGVSEKAQNSFEDCLTKVPLLIKPPKLESVDAGITDSFAELIDFYATIQDYAGLEKNYTHFGISLRPVLENRLIENRDYVCCEGGRLPEEIHCDEFHSGGPKGTNPYNPYYPRHKAQTDDEAHAKGVMIRNHNYKLVSRVIGQDEFYDLRNDPDEKINQIRNQDFANEVARMHGELSKWYLRTSDVVPFDMDQRFSFDMKWAKVKKYVPEEYEVEIKEKIVSGINIFMLVQECRERFIGQE